MNYDNLRTEFNSLSPINQWQFAINHKDYITIYLDNDCTSFTFDCEDKTEDCTIFYFTLYIGNSGGIIPMLKLFGFKSQHV